MSVTRCSITAAKRVGAAQSHGRHCVVTDGRSIFFYSSTSAGNRAARAVAMFRMALSASACWPSGLYASIWSRCRSNMMQGFNKAAIPARRRLSR